MNKTLSIALAGYSFVIEEHAYIKLSDYLSALRNSMEKEEVEEVMNDIEIRIVEIFRETLGKREVVSTADVEKVIDQLGSPETIGEQEEMYYSESTSKGKSSENYSGYKRQLFRDPEKAKIAGVCAGLAHYMGMDVSIMRAIWLFFAVMGIFTVYISTSFVVLIYIILWIVLPEAKTASDFLKMYGKPLNFDNIKEESTKIFQFVNDSSRKAGDFYNQNKSTINTIATSMLKVLSYLIGFVFAAISVTCIVGVVVGFSVIFSLNTAPIEDFEFYFGSDTNLYLIGSIIVLSALIPAIMFGYVASKLFAPHIQYKNIGGVILVLFLSLCAISVFTGFSIYKTTQGFSFSGDKIETEEVMINTPSDTLYIEEKKVEIPQNFKGYNGGRIFSDKKMIYDSDRPYVSISRKEDVAQPYLIIKKKAYGYNQPIKISVPIEILGNRISLPNYLKYSYEDRFRRYSVRYELVVPKSMTILPPSNTKNIIIDKDFDDYFNNTEGNIENNSEYKEVSSFNINGTKVEYNSDRPNEIRINHKAQSIEQAEKILDSLNIDIDDIISRKADENKRNE